MTFPNPEASPLKVRSIRRKQVQQQLARSSIIVILAISGCSNSTETSTDTSTIPPPPTPPPTVAPPKVPSLFYSTTEQCEADAKKQQIEYETKLNVYEANKNSPKPIPPAIGSADCGAQMAAARREHDRHAPVYQSLSTCQSDGVQCETAPPSSGVTGYRPIFGGTYLYPYAANATSNFAGNDYRVYQPYTVYQGLNPGQVITPQGDPVSQVRSGRVSAPQPSNIDAPARPAGYAAEGTIRGRGQSGFGSTYKSTGRGGK